MINIQNTFIIITLLSLSEDYVINARGPRLLILDNSKQKQSFQSLHGTNGNKIKFSGLNYEIYNVGTLRNPWGRISVKPNYFLFYKI